MQVTKDDIMEIRERNPLREVMLDYGIQIDRDDKSHCPFHQNDDTPSFQIYEFEDHSKDNYRCYGCEAGTKGQTLRVYRGNDVIEVVDGGSDVIGFVQNVEQVSFPEACKILMERCGMPIPIEDPEVYAMRQRITKKNREYWTHLQSRENALDYLYGRGLDDEDIAKWRIGLVPSDHPNEQLRNRIAFGLIDMYADPNNAQTIAMAYRTLGSDKSKYINDPTSESYQKKRFLYGMTFARKAIRQKGYAVVVEGYMDVIHCHKAGMDNTVGTCGTAFADEQMDELRKQTDKVVFWYDGDSAGKTAMERALPRLLERGFNVLFVQGSTLDPAEMFMKTGREATVKWVQNNTKPAVMMVIDRVANELDVAMAKLQTEALDKILPILDSVIRKSDSIIYRNYVAKRFNVLL